MTGGRAMSAANLVGRWFVIVLLVGVSACGGGGGGGSGLSRHLQLNTASDVLYVSTPTGSIFRISGASTANASSIAAVTLRLTVGLNESVTDIALDATRDVLYVAFNRASGGTVG